ncbi:MAG: hypothetical protein ACJ76J_11940 [Thermoanaerobaculia bacterium]
MELVRYGWIEPVLRVELPKSLYLSWENFPNYPGIGTITEEDCWASHLWALGALVKRGSVDPQSETWYRHFLDVPDHWVTRAALAHQLPAGGSQEPESFEHPRPRGRTILPWIDFFAYWQAYHIAEILQAVYIDTAPRLPGAKRKLEALLARADEFEEHAQLRLSMLRKRWEKRREVFDWLSRFRTVIGIWGHEHRFPGDAWTEERFDIAVKAMIREMGLTFADLMSQIREHLLTLWSEWGQAPQASPAKLLLQQDIALAVALVGRIKGEPVAYDDPFWEVPANGMLRQWAPLPSVLPFEADEAKREFPIHAEIALSDSEFNQVVPQERRLNEGVIEKITAKWWPRSAAFRRFALAYDRLYRHYAGRINKQRLVGIEEETPIEFLILCALHVEKLLGERLVPNPPKTFKERVHKVACLVGKPYGVQNQKAFLDELRDAIDKKTKLHDLPQNPDDPFTEEADFQHPEPVARLFLKILVNSVVLRNYSAHHDCIDAQLFQEGWVAAGVEALMVTTLTILTVSAMKD